MQDMNLIEQEQPVGLLTTAVPAPAPTITLCSYGNKLTREELARVRISKRPENTSEKSGLFFLQIV